MEQVYNHTQDKPSYHDRGIRNKAADIQSKADILKGTADSHSGTELTSTKAPDIQNDTARGTQLDAKANQLATKAGELYRVAGALETAADTGELATLKQAAGNLKNAAKKTGGGDDHLYYAANALATHPGGPGLENKAKDVIDKFEAVKAAYDELAKKKEYKEAIEGKLTLTEEQKQKVTDVEREYNQLENIYDQMLKLTKLAKKAKTLNSTPEIAGSSGTELATLKNKPSQLATKAQDLSTAAKLVSDPDLRGPAGNLAQAASRTDGLQQKATDLQSDQDYDSKAKPVIQAFDNVKQEFDALINLAITNDKLPLVQDVISKFEDLKTYYDTMMPFTKIKYYSEEIETQANNLRTESGGTTNADKIVRYFESMELAYSKLPATNSVKTPFEALNNTYSQILKFSKGTKLRVAAGESPILGLRGKADALYNAANLLNEAVKNVAADDKAAKVLKYKAGTSAQTSDTKYLRKLAADLYNKANSLHSAAQGNSADANESLKQKAGTTENDGLRKLAKELYEAAQALALVAVTDGGGASDGGKANDLVAAVGANETGAGIRKKLKLLASANGGTLNAAAQAVRSAYDNGGGDGVKPKFLAVQLQETVAYKDGDKKTAYDKVEAAWNAFDNLYTANLKGLAEGLKTAIGDTGAGGKLQGALIALGNLQDTAAELTNKAGKVKTAYEGSGDDGVKPKFTALQAKGPAYQAIASIRPKYDDVVSAMTAFDNVYRPEELLKDAVGQETGQNSLAKALAALGTARDAGDLTALVKAVKDKYSNFISGGVKQKFGLVKNQEQAYEKGGTIKNNKYDQLETAWTKFNNKYYEAISTEKFYSIVFTSIITILS